MQWVCPHILLQNYACTLQHTESSYFPPAKYAHWFSRLLSRERVLLIHVCLLVWFYDFDRRQFLCSVGYWHKRWAPLWSSLFLVYGRASVPTSQNSAVTIVSFSPVTGKDDLIPDNLRAWRRVFCCFEALFRGGWPAMLWGLDWVCVPKISNLHHLHAKMMTNQTLILLWTSNIVVVSQSFKQWAIPWLATTLPSLCIANYHLQFECECLCPLLQVS